MRRNLQKTHLDKGKDACYNIVKNKGCQMLIKVAIVEDEESCALQTKEFLKNFEKESEHRFDVDIFSNGLDFLVKYRSNYEIVFMDIEMPFKTGIETAKRMRSQDNKAALIFITNSTKYAIASYEVNAIDYILKPIEYFNFTVKLKKALRQIEALNKESLFLPQEDGLIRLAIDDILYIEVSDHKLLFHCSSLHYEIRGTLNRFEEKLVQHGFSMCNQCYLVNLRYVKKIEGVFVILSNDEILQISRPKRKKFIKDLQQSQGV